MLTNENFEKEVSIITGAAQTHVCVVLAYLKICNVDFDAACIAFSTISTGGFMTHSLGMEDYNNASLLVVTCFMLLSGVNMALLYNLVTLLRRFRR